MDGILPVYKPAGITSYDVIRQLKRRLPRGQKIGHGGTLDPFAQGVLLILLGKATKQFDNLREAPKTYLTTAKLGAASDTLDCTGTISRAHGAGSRTISKQEIQQVADKYVGEIEQVVPAYAAAKYKGRKLYEYAREGVEVPVKKKLVMIYSIEVIDTRPERVVMRINCGSGTYIRQLSYDIFKELGIESYLDELVREAVGQYQLKDALQLSQATSLDTVMLQVQPVPDESGS